MGKIKLIVRAVVENSRGQVLLLKRSSHDSYPGQWEYPGGKVEYGEAPGSAVSRELYEETGLNGVALYPVEVVSNLSEDGQEQRIKILFRGIPIVGEEVVWLSDEHDDYQWVHKDSLPGSLR
ncbi:MAG: NUDIX hydrolase [Candidatus Levybacteria bacterium]|nr:NUDIX hydrolase [Candidatus Levybacteria bacterium]